jgi:penicillin-binding protein 1A
VIDAFISAEDKTFFSHGGIDYPGLVGAVFDYAARSVTGGRARGGSTITQQVAKYLLQDSSYNIGRKIREAILAFRLESTLSKQQILEIYLNSIFLGRNAYGVRPRAVPISTRTSATDLPGSGLSRGPAQGAVQLRPDPRTPKALDRRNYVLREMSTTATSPRPVARRPASPLGTIRYGSNEKFRQMGGYFMEEVRRDADQALRREGGQRARTASTRRLWVRTSMVPSMQDAAAEALREGLPSSTAAAAGATPSSASTSNGDWGRSSPSPRRHGFPDWKKAVVLSKRRRARRSASPTARQACFRRRRPAAQARRRRQRFST